MPALINARHEKFCQNLARGKSPIDSYRAAGFKVGNDRSASVCACKLQKLPNVQARIVEIQSASASRAIQSTGITKAWVMQALRDNYHRAIDTDQIPAANQAVHLLGKELGMFVDRKDFTMRSIEDLPDSVLEQIIAQADDVESVN